MLSKWMYVAEALKHMGYNDMGVLAEQINNELIQIYGKDTTPMWKEHCDDYPSPIEVSMNTLADIIPLSCYCVGCVESAGDCDVCRFRLEGDGCKEPSKYDKIYTFVCKKAHEETLSFIGKE